MWAFIRRHYEFFVVLGAFIFFRVFVRSDPNDHDAFCQTHSYHQSYQGFETFSTHREAITDYWIQFRGGEHVVELQEPRSTSLFLHQNSGRLLFVIFYSPNCAYCTKSVPEFASAAELVFNAIQKERQVWKSSTSGSGEKRDCDKVQFVAVNCKHTPKICHDERIDGYPTFLLYRDGVRAEEYIKLRTAPKFFEYIMVQRTKREGASSWRSWISFL